MLAPLATLTFLIGLWLVVKLGLDLFAEEGLKIAAAFAGRSLLARPRQSVHPISVRFQQRAGSVPRPLRVQPTQRAAA